MGKIYFSDKILKKIGKVGKAEFSVRLSSPIEVETLEKNSLLKEGILDAGYIWANFLLNPISGPAVLLAIREEAVFSSNGYCVMVAKDDYSSDFPSDRPTKIDRLDHEIGSLYWVACGNFPERLRGKLYKLV